MNPHQLGRILTFPQRCSERRENLRLAGGGRSLVRTFLFRAIPVNRKKYREYRTFRPVVYWLALGLQVPYRKKMSIDGESEQTGIRELTGNGSP